ncbi:MAG: DUF5723 family protein [Bacteroidales bacterium]
MNLNIKKILLVCNLLVAAVWVNGQNMRSAYFLDGFYYRHQMNPAFAPERAYFSFPGLGNLNISAQGNVGLSDFLYSYDDPFQESVLTTFMNHTVGQQEFLSRLNARNKVAANVDMSIISFGFKAWGGFNTFGMGLHSRSNVNAPYELFDFMKSGELGGDASKSYFIKDLQLRSSNYIDVSFGHSRKINEKLTVGASLKLLLGIGHAETEFDNMHITMGEDEWLINANGYMHTSAKGLMVNTKEDREIKDFEIRSGGIGGYGVGVDLGASYRLLENLTLSAAFTDIGFIRWVNTIKGSTSNDPYSFKGFETIGIGGDSEYPSLEDQFDDLGTDFKEMARFYDDGKINKATALATTMNIGAEYELPAYRKLSFGLLSSTHIQRPYTWTEARFAINIAPLNWLEASVSGAWSTYGGGFGFLVNFHPKGFNLFLGTDFMITEITPQYIPVHNMNANVCMGINFSLGKR